MRDVIITVESAEIAGYGIFQAGTYLISCPEEYDVKLITAEDIVLDCQISVVRSN